MRRLLCVLVAAGGHRSRRAVGHPSFVLSLASLAPEKPQVWVAQWNPNVQNQSKYNLDATMTVDFSANPGMFEAFYGKFSLINDTGLSWGPGDKATLRFRRRKRWAR